MSQLPKDRFIHHGRVRARRTAVQALYQWDLTGRGMDEIVAEFETDRAELKRADGEYFRGLVSGIAAHAEDLREQIAMHCDRKVTELDPVERAILYLGGFELLYRPEVPWRTIVNESVELAKMFGAEQSHRYINGVLDRMAHRVRPVEADGTV